MARFNALTSVINAYAKILRKAPLRYDVALLSRQSAQPSSDYAILYRRLCETLGEDRVVMETCDSELGDKRSFVHNMYTQLVVACRSRVVVLDGYNPAVCIPDASSRTRVVQLWHATGALKKFGFQSLDTPAGRSSAYAATAHMHQHYDWIIAAGPGAVASYAQAFGYEEDRIAALGMPRMDYLMDSSPDSLRLRRDRQLRAAFPFLSSGRTNVLYAPTLRKGAGYDNWIATYLYALLEACPQDAVNLVYAGHPLDCAFPHELSLRYPALRFCPGASTVDLLESADYVITDYSSIALEAGLIGKNVLFFVPDLETYEKSPGLNIDLSDHRVCFASTDGGTIMQAALSPEPVPGAANWKRYCARYFEGITLGSTQRVVDFILDQLHQLR